MSKKAITQKQLETSEKVHALRLTMTDEDLALLIDITKKTLYNRLKLNNWRKGEMCLINGLDF